LEAAKENEKVERDVTNIAFGVFAVFVALLMACSSPQHPVGSHGTAWGPGSFRSNGERIYFTATSGRGTSITYTGGPASNGGMMVNGRLACASCHGAGGQGGKHYMRMMDVMDAKDIRWSALKEEFDFEKFKAAVTKGQDPDGTQLKTEMPRWNIGDEDLTDLIAYLQTLP
jgi:hypothetical protein